MAWYPDKDIKFKRQARLYDIAVCSWNGSVFEGKITMISEKGINIKYGSKTMNFKWGNVQSIREPRVSTDVGVSGTPLIE